MEEFILLQQLLSLLNTQKKFKESTKFGKGHTMYNSKYLKNN